ncbi:hypothetical protein N7495_000485 [Penicillium taxi]|uniref:uncharacterized protein n=1 Tax=Penicillium taxi TaxID=168475 RepID=UPI0025454CF1|nr:uncharacterized protein N7495_000485 [Penicillium taxi]KAJ5907803.1 hypothetical protein N7495_000485 [Penicillium taxi]
MRSEEVTLQTRSLLVTLAAVHTACKQMERAAAIYGILTDGSTWIFMHITESSHYSERVFHWNEDRDQIIFQVQEIINKAADLSRSIVMPRPTRFIKEEGSVSSTTGCYIGEIYNPDEAYFEEDYEAEDEVPKELYTW